MEEGTRLDDQYYIIAESARVRGETHVLKHGETFAIFDHLGDIPLGWGELGLYHAGTRHLSHLELRLNGTRPVPLGSAVRVDNAGLVVDLTSAELVLDRGVRFPRGVLHLVREKFLFDSACYERVRLTNYGAEAMTLSLSLHFGADFADLFEVRGHFRPKRGQQLDPATDAGELVLGYVGLDGVTRRTAVGCSPLPSSTGDREVGFMITLPARGSESIHWTVRCEPTDSIMPVRGYDETFGALRAAIVSAHESRPRIKTDNEQFNAWIRQSSADLVMLLTRTPQGLYPYAGVPWFSTAFSRDGVITALELLWLDPAIARGVLTYLAATQATEVNPRRDAEPGKILHETRRGEMAALGEVPFERYYGSVDATPLFVLLAGAYYERTADLPFVESIRPNIDAALRWIDTYGDLDGDGLVEYIRRAPDGLVQQGWKDSSDSVFHADGTLAEPPIALCEVQAYVYLAKRHAASLFANLEDADSAARLMKEAEALRVRFERLFWSEELSTYAMALDGRKRQCRVRSSNAGHCLFGRIASPERAVHVARALTAGDMFSGWGVRTLGANEARYNPMSYHNGSVWPHDNAIVAAGLSQYGFTDAVTVILRALFDLSSFRKYRMPELTCGFDRRPDELPVEYPVACSPQAWAAGAVFMLLQSSLGLSIQRLRQQIRLERPRLPDCLRWVEIRNLRVGDGTLDLRLERHAVEVAVEVLRRSGEVEVVAIT
jgi:glycogen debranching enzyme